jgi:hypothetical protein
MLAETAPVYINWAFILCLVFLDLLYKIIATIINSSLIYSPGLGGAIMKQYYLQKNKCMIQEIIPFFKKLLTSGTQILEIILTISSEDCVI